MKKRIMMLLGGLAVVSVIAVSKPSMAAAVSKEEVRKMEIFSVLHIVRPPGGVI